MKTNTVQIGSVKFLKKGLKAGGKYFPCYYSVGELTSGGIAITIYAKSIVLGLPRELQPENKTDLQSDYFDTDKVRFMEGSAQFEALKGLCRSSHGSQLLATT